MVTLRIPRVVVALFALLVLGAVPIGVEAQTTDDTQLQSEVTRSDDNFFVSLTYDRKATVGHYKARVPTRRGAHYCRYAVWDFLGPNGDGTRSYGATVYDGCLGDAPVNVDKYCQLDSLPNHGVTQPVGKQYSYCVSLASREVPLGLTPQNCGASATAGGMLNLTTTPQAYDARQPTTLTAAASFTNDAIDRLSDGFCTAVASWQVTGWTVTWPDQHVDQLPGSGHDPLSATHQLAANPGGSASTQPGTVTVTAHIHLAGSALDFDENANIVRNPSVQADVDVTRSSDLNATSGAPTYVPPQLQAGGVPDGQQGDGTIPPPPDMATTATAHAAAIRGRLCLTYPKAVVVAPGVETVGGVTVGRATSSTTGWTYTGDLTDAPTREGTRPGDTGPLGTPIVEQWNHAERLDPISRDPIDEQVPMTITVHTVWPDGHAEDETVSGSVGISIYYPALSG